MSEYLKKFIFPEALKELSSSQLDLVAREIRKKIIQVGSRIGGHIASSLGAVELSVALHATFNSPQDKLVWDVGHQAYAHKILTGRLGGFDSIRQMGGLSGFPNKDESPHDPFTVGHASNSISCALGLVKARDLQNEKHFIVAILGDGSFSGGLAWEAINNASTLKTNFIIILNDNEMSISKNVGAVATYLTQIATSPIYNTARDRIEKVIEKIPKIGVSMLHAAEKLKDRTKHLIMDIKMNVLFEELGYKYFGPIDGHNIPLLMSTLSYAKEVQRPVLIHVLTKKGKGLQAAENDPTAFHSAVPFDPETGDIIEKKGFPSYTSIFGKTMVELAKKDQKVCAITAAMPDGTGLANFAKEFPSRFFDVGIAEEHAVSFAAGLARGGLKPVVAIYSTFLQRSFDQIIHDVCLQNLPVVFAIDRAGIVGEDGATHNGVFDLAYMRQVPNMVVMAPKDENELQHMLFTAVNHPGPISIRYPRGSGYGVKLDKELKNLEIGKAEIVSKLEIRNSTLGICIIAIGTMVNTALEAAKLLEKENIAAVVINARFVKPLDKALILGQTKDCQLVVTLEEGGLSGGFGSAVFELFSENNVKIPLKCLGLPDKFLEHGPRAKILAMCGLSLGKIVEAVKNFYGN